MGILSVNLNKINLDFNLEEDDPDTIIIIITGLLGWHSKFKKHKALKEKIREELMPGEYKFRVLEHFDTENYT